MLYKEDIAKVNRWFKKKEKGNGYGTYHHTARTDGEDLYAVDGSDVEEFCSFLEDSFPDLVCFSCNVAGCGIWFSSKDLKQARTY